MHVCFVNMHDQYIVSSIHPGRTPRSGAPSSTLAAKEREAATLNLTNHGIGPKEQIKITV
jgi:hypothetical protein